MNIFGAAVTFIVIWWVVLFTVLPWGIRSQIEEENNPEVRGTDPGAPNKANIWPKFLTTTLISAVVWIFFFSLFYMDILSINLFF